MSGAPALVDLHCHFVPEVDDGAATFDDALHYLREFDRAGIRRVVTTPHLSARHAGGPRQAEIRERFDRLRERAATELPQLELGLGFEIRLTGDEFDATDPGLHLDGGPALLFEFPMLSLPAYPFAFLQPVLGRDLVLVLAHPERYTGIRAGYDWLPRLRKEGIRMCVNAGSLWGEYGPEAEGVARRMLAEGHADLMASDHHGRPGRSTSLADAREWLLEHDAEAATRLLLSRNPAATLAGEPAMPVPGVSANESWLGRLRRFVGGRAS